jgi:hypothetical protein
MHPMNRHNSVVTVAATQVTLSNGTVYTTETQLENRHMLRIECSDS